MRHLYVFYFMLTLAIGAISVGVAATLYKRNKDDLLLHYLYFYAPFTFLVVLNIVLSYLRVNVPEIHPYLLGTLVYLENPVALYLVLFTVPVFVHYFAEVSGRRGRNVLIGAVVLIMLIGRHLWDSIAGQLPTLDRIVGVVDDSIFVAIMVYCVVLGLRRARTLSEPFQQRLARRFFTLFAVFLPGIVNDTFFSEVSALRFYPILYCGLSLVVTYELLRHPRAFQQPAPEMPAEAARPSDAFLDRYNISAREKDVIGLMLQGQSNQQISESLCISLNTVKTHIRNIYQKFAIANRAELLAIIKNSPS